MPSLTRPAMRASNSSGQTPRAYTFFEMTTGRSWNLPLITVPNEKVLPP